MSGPRDERQEWGFWLPDEDRSAGWTNHCYVLQWVCEGYGDTPAEAWDEAKAAGRVPEGFVLPETLRAIRSRDEQVIAAD